MQNFWVAKAIISPYILCQNLYSPHPPPKKYTYSIHWTQSKLRQGTFYHAIYPFNFQSSNLCGLFIKWIALLMSQCNNYENNVQRLPFGLITIKKKNCPKYCFKCHSFLKIINVSCTLCPAGLVEPLCWPIRYAVKVFKD